MPLIGTVTLYRCSTPVLRTAAPYRSSQPSQQWPSMDCRRHYWPVDGVPNQFWKALFRAILTPHPGPSVMLQWTGCPAWTTGSPHGGFERRRAREPCPRHSAAATCSRWRRRCRWPERLAPARTAWKTGLHLQTPRAWRSGGAARRNGGQPKASQCERETGTTAVGVTRAPLLGPCGRLRVPHCAGAGTAVCRGGGAVGGHSTHGSS